MIHWAQRVHSVVSVSAVRFDLPLFFRYHDSHAVTIASSFPLSSPWARKALASDAAILDRTVRSFDLRNASNRSSIPSGNVFRA